jgi:hypothetical protein
MMRSIAVFAVGLAADASMRAQALAREISCGAATHRLRHEACYRS